jgi:DNA replication protein DnaC
MDTQLQPSAPASATAAPDAETELAKFVSANRQQPPPLPERAVFSHLAFTSAESVEAAAAREADANKRAELRRVAELRERWANLVRDAGQRYRDCTLENFDARRGEQRAVVAALREYIAEDSPDGVILFGPVGTGKDHLAFAICRAAIKAGQSVRWVNGQNWFGMVRDAMDTSKSEASLIAELARPEILCLSDPLPPVGALTQHQATMLYRLVDARYSRGVPTICTLNVADDAEADVRMGAATWDRLCHDAWKLHCNWPTYRKPAREVKSLRVRSA